MIEQALVYIYSVGPGRRFIGCGALVEGGYVATCRHVWRTATEKAGQAETGGPSRVEIEYPRVQENGNPARRSAQLADACEAEAGQSLDLVLLRPDEIPPARATILQLASHERFQSGSGYAIAGLVRDRTRSPRDAKIMGTIADHEDASGRREFTGDNASAYWFEPGSSGSPVFVDGGEQLAGIVSLSETGANEGKAALHEAFVVPGTTIRAHVHRLIAASVAHKQYLEFTEQQAVLTALNVPDVQVARNSARAASRAEAYCEDDTVDDAIIGGAIRIANERLASLDVAGAKKALREVDVIYRNKLIRILEKKADVEILSHDHEAAKITLKQLLSLDPDRVQDWIALGRLHVATEFVAEAENAFNAAVEAARRSKGKDSANDQ